MESAKKIKILFVLDRIKYAGTQLHALELVERLNKDEFDSRACCLDGRDPYPGIMNLGIKKIYGFGGIKGLMQLVRYIKREEFDIVHTFLFNEDILGVIAAHLAKAKVIITDRRGTGKFIHGARRHIFAYRIINRWVGKIICVSNAVREIVKIKERVSDAKLITIYNGVDIEKFRIRKSPSQMKSSLGLKDDEFAVGIIANFSWIKGHKDIIVAAKTVIKTLPNTKFIFIGDGALFKKCKKLTEDSGIDKNILFLGRRDDIPELLPIMDVAVNASYSEGMSNAILEAMAAGVPVVATAVDGNLETVVDGTTGILVPPKNPETMASAIIKILSDRKLARKMGDEAREVVKNKFTSEIMIKNTEDLYRDLLKPKIAYILSQFPVTSETFILREIKALQSRNVNIKIISLKPCRDKIIHPEAMELMRHTIYAHAVTFRSVRFSICYPNRTLKTLSYVITTYTSSPLGLIKALYVWLECISLADIIKKDGITHIHSHWATMPTTAAVILSKLVDIPFSFTAHAWDIFVDNPGLGEKIEKAKFVVTCTEYNKEYLKELVTKSQGHKVTGNGKIYRSYHGIDLDKFSTAQTTSHIENKILRILAVGRLVETKGFEYLINACNILRGKGIDFVCNIVGKGPLLQRHKSQVASYKLEDRIKFLGIRTQEEIKKLYSEATILVQPSVIAKDGDRDGIPNVILEAMAMGIPVIATNLSGIPEAVIDSHSGILVPERDSYALSKAMETIWSDIRLRAMLNQNGRPIIKEKFNIEKNTKELVNIFEQNGVLV